jgi:hypothetical protein
VRDAGADRQVGGFVAQGGGFTYEGTEALASVEIDMRQIPGHGPKYHLNRGRIFYLMGEHAGAVQDLERVASITPDVSNVRLLLGAAYDGAGQEEEAKSQVRAQCQAVPWTDIERILLVTPFPQPQLDGFLGFLRRYGIRES